MESEPSAESGSSHRKSDPITSGPAASEGSHLSPEGLRLSSFSNLSIPPRTHSISAHSFKSLQNAPIRFISVSQANINRAPNCCCRSFKPGSKIDGPSQAGKAMSGANSFPSRRCLRLCHKRSPGMYFARTGHAWNSPLPMRLDLGQQIGNASNYCCSFAPMSTGLPSGA